MNRRRHLFWLFWLSVTAGVVPGAATAQTRTAVTPSTSFYGTPTSEAQTMGTGSEVRIAGTVEKLVSTPTQGIPRGLHLILAGPHGIFDASVGPYLSTDVKDSLIAGQRVEITGVAHTFNGQDFVLVRELTVVGRQIVIRNEKGFLIHSQPPAVARVHPNHSGTNGDSH